MKPFLIIPLVLLAAVGGCADRDEAVDPATAALNPTLTDIWVAELLDSRRRLRLGTPRNVTDRPGYDNQPHFLPDGSGFLYTAMDANGQADTWRYEFERGRRFRVTRTPESEYSPTPHPDGGFTVVRVEADGAQRLWRFRDDGDEPQLLLEAIAPVGYQAWFNAHRVALFVLGEPPTLVVANLADGGSEIVLQSVGRSMHPVQGKGTVSVVHKVSADEWNVVEIALDGTATKLATLPRPSEDFAWLPDGQLVVGHGSRLLMRRPGGNDGWQEIADFSEYGIEQITRIAVSPTGDRIAFVAQR
ncbi:MAG: hypothetical protein LC632_06645 [Xanthomonadaceae bacterium]|nr:hypothetical protein [Xanthomonadaceae bacterium]